MLKKMVLGVVAVTALAVSAVPAHADPKFKPVAGDLAGVGSDTTQDVVGALANAYNKGRKTGRLASYDATPKGSKITTKPGTTAIARPDGSSAGIKALLTDGQKGIDFARSSRAKKTDGSEAALTFYPFAQDGVTWATNWKTNAPSSLTKAQLGRIYRCAVNARYWDQVGGKKTKKRQRIKPYLPQEGSGTRSFFLTAIGLTDAQVGSCVNTKLQENDGKVLPKKDANYLAAYSIGKWIAQAVNKKNDRHGTTVLRKINKEWPTTGRLKVNAKNGKVTGSNVRVNVGDFPRTFLRFVYNVVRTAEAAKFAPIFGADGFVCDQPKIIRSYGFEPLGGGCGLPQ